MGTEQLLTIKWAEAMSFLCVRRTAYIWKTSITIPMTAAWKAGGLFTLNMNTFSTADIRPASRVDRLQDTVVNEPTSK